MLSTAIFAWLHIVSAIGWLGGGIMFGFVVAPALSKLSPASSGEFFMKIVPRVARFFQIVAGSTVLFGVLLLYTGISNGDFSGLTLSSTWGLSIVIGLSLGFIAFLVSEFVAVPPLRKAIRIITEMHASGQQEPPPELQKTLKRAGLLANVTVTLLILAVVFMVSAGFY
jgi:uncharacterized membrane protein